MATSIYTLTSNVRYRLSDQTDEAYDSTLFTNAANEAARIFATTTGCNQAIHNFTSGAAAYIALSNLTYEYINVYEVQHASIKLHWAPRSEAVKWSPAAGTPTGWNVWANTLYLDAIATLSSTNDIDVHYTYAPAVITSGNLDIPDKWMPAIEAYMRYYIYEKMRDEGLAANAYAEFESFRDTAARTYEAQMSRGGRS